MWELVKQIGQNLTAGTSLTSITLPITISEPRSYLEMVADGWCYAPLLLKQAAVETNPVERMKLSVAFAVAGLSNTCCVKKPFNPIVGRSPCTPDFPIFLAIFASLCSLQILTRAGMGR